MVIFLLMAFMVYSQDLDLPESPPVEMSDTHQEVAPPRFAERSQLEVGVICFDKMGRFNTYGDRGYERCLEGSVEGDVPSLYEDESVRYFYMGIQVD